MPVPKKRQTKSKRNKRRMHIFLRFPHLVKCQKCGKLILSHYACPYCGYYKEREVIDVLKKMSKKEKKRKKETKK